MRSALIDSTMPSWALGATLASPLKTSAGGGFRVDWVGLAALATHLAVHAVDFDHLDSTGAKYAGEVHPIGPRALDADLVDLPERSHPVEKNTTAPSVVAN